MTVVQKIYQGHRSVCHACVFQSPALGVQGLLDIFQNVVGPVFPTEHLAQGSEHFAGFFKGFVAFFVDTDDIRWRDALQQAGGRGHFRTGDDQVRFQLGNGFQARCHAGADIGNAVWQFRF